MPGIPNYENNFHFESQPNFNQIKYIEVFFLFNVMYILLY